MATQEVKRKLTAILSADVKGYSRLMSEDEIETIRTLNAYKEMMANLIQHHHGRVVDAPGDNILAEFASVVDAVQCAVEIQKDLKIRNAELPENRRMEFRLGINLGDVVEEEGRIFGDGVNIAARLESLAEAGGICISGTAFDHVRNKLELGYEYLGEQTVKNIALPVRVYKVLIDSEAAGKVLGEKKAKTIQWRRAAIGLTVAVVVVVSAVMIWKFYISPTPPVEKADPKKMAYPLPDKPSIAVLPFANMTGDASQEFLMDGFTEEIINALSKLPQVFVIARNSSFTYKGKPVKVQQVAEELGVQYVLEGSVRKEENRIRITAQLIDAITGRHVFSERYDRELKEIFATQDEIAIKVLTALRVAMKDEERARFHARGVSNVEAYFKLLEAFELTQKVNKESNAQARRLAEEALALEPGSSRAYYVLALTHHWDFWLGPPKSPEESIAQGIEMARKAIALDERNPYPHGTLALLYMNKGDYDRAVEEGERAVSLDPNSPYTLVAYGSTLHHASRPAEAIAVLQKALRFSPANPPSMALAHIAASHRTLGQYDEAVRFFKRVLKEYPGHFSGNLGLTATYSVMDRLEEARAQAEEVMRLNPKFSMERWAKTLHFKDPAEVERFLEALRKAGLK